MDLAPRLNSKILIFAPTGNDGPVTAAFLSHLGHQTIVCQSMKEVRKMVNIECDILLLAEETLDEDSIDIIGSILVSQAAWSDIPIALITSHENVSQKKILLETLGQDANINLIERPFRRETLLSAVNVALRARQRQLDIRDLLEEKKNAQVVLERQVKERTFELTESNDHLETLVYSIAHDLRAPLRSMQAFANILLEDYATSLDETATKYAQRIVKSAETLDTLVLDLLAYGKTARSNVDIEMVDLEVVWNSALSMFEPDIVETGAIITTVRPLPWVRANSTMLSQVLANLLGNALKFVPEDCSPEIVFRGEDQGETVRISVQDNGLGIAPEYQEKIFRVFERLKNESKTEGTGIGLAIVRKGVERMLGRVGVESAPPKRGSTFWIELPK